MPININELSPSFLCEENSGWLTIRTRDAGCTKRFRTSRLGKLMPGGELQFSIGATKHGRSVGLNDVIESQIRDAGFAVITRHSTAGGRTSHYPAFDARRADTAKVLGVLLGVESEVKRIIGNRDAGFRR